MIHPVTQALLSFSLAEAELHDAIDTLTALRPQAHALLRTLGTALLAERRTTTLTITGAEGNAFLRAGSVPDASQLELALFVGIERSICWSLGDLALGWDHTEDDEQGGVFYWSAPSVRTQCAAFDVAQDLFSPERNGGGWLWEVWSPRAGGTIPYSRGGHLDKYLEQVLTVHDWAADDENPARTAADSKPRRRRRRQHDQR